MKPIAKLEHTCGTYYILYNVVIETTKYILVLVSFCLSIVILFRVILIKMFFSLSFHTELKKYVCTLYCTSRT